MHVLERFPSLPREQLLRAGDVVVTPIGARLPSPQPDPGPMPSFICPSGMHEGVAAYLFGEVTANNGDVYRFDPNGDISRAWLVRGNETGRYSGLVSVQIYSEGEPEQRQYFQLSDGWVVWRPSMTEVFRDMGNVSRE
jgi:hypothetical protein